MVTPKLLLFDDVPAMRAELTLALTRALNGDGEVQQFYPDDSADNKGTYESRLTEDLSKAPNSGATLIVADQDLSQYVPKYSGLSEFTVRQVATELGVPQCGYARGGGTGSSFLERGEEQESCIRLSLEPTYDVFASRVVAVEAGFRDLYSKLAGLKEVSPQAPGKLLAACLDVPEFAAKIALYASGDRNRLAYVSSKKRQTEDEAKRKVACFLGYWLWDSVLRFPGVTVGTTAASSYLNIGSEEFANDVQVVFESAKYTGPFAAAKVPMWWRGKLDDLIARSGASDGREMASRVLGRDITGCVCSVDPTQKAGYYCMLTEKPVSLEKSAPGLPWFPRGADLARISKPALEELGPWI